MAAITRTPLQAGHFSTTSTTAETWCLQRPVKSLRITNKSTTDMYVTIKTSNTLTTDDAGIVTAVAAAAETICIPAVLTSGTRSTKEVWRSPSSRFLQGSIVGSASAYDIEGYDWY